MPSPSRIADAIADQIAANASARAHAAAGGRGRVCLLGAGNAHDVDLDALGAAFAEIHLVDVDSESVGGALARAPDALRPRLFAHAPLDVSGILDHLEGWAARPPAMSALEREVPLAVGRVAGCLPGPFDVVASCCLLTQLQLVLLQMVGDRHPRFAELRGLVN